MMKSIQTALLTLVGVLLYSGVSAHALWIETKGAGKVGQAQEVNLFYGEYAQNERDVTAKWYSDVKDLTLWLVGPDQKKIQLKTQLGDNVAKASFTPEMDGQYTLLVSHAAKDLAGTTKYQFLTSTVVQVGKVAALNADAISNDLKIYPVSAVNKVNNVIKLKTAQSGTAKAAATVSVFSPSGWSQVLTTDANGEAEFKPLWPGTYVVEVTDFQKAAGDHNGKPFDAFWQGSTYSFTVK